MRLCIYKLQLSESVGSTFSVE